ncbi:hypothetical protein RHO13_02120 [Orbus wheelerorum]|uniref:calcium-binding protein n=1 Tax=Orbus wheelerorum TaxID=3074111 RepID=UPI00370D114B
MGTVNSLKSAANTVYSAEAFAYIKGLKSEINDIASILGISAGAIAGAIVEERHAYSTFDYLLDKYATLNYVAGQHIDPPNALTDVGSWIKNNLNKKASKRTHQDWADSYQWAKENDKIYAHPSKTEKILNPILIDAGPANFRIAVAIDMVNKYAAQYPSLNLAQYINHYDMLVYDLISQKSELTAILYGLYIKNDAEPFFIKNNAYNGQWDRLPQEFKDALLITYTNNGEEALQKKVPTDGSPYLPQPGADTSGGMNHLLNSQKIGNLIGLNGYGDQVKLGSAELIYNSARLQNDEGIATRYMLKNLRYVSISTLDYSEYNKNGEIDLYDVETGLGQMSEQYLYNRSILLEAYVQDKIGSGLNQNTISGLYLQDMSTAWQAGNKNGMRYIFGTDSDDIIEGASQTDYLYGGDGNDIIMGGDGEDYIEGGDGDDILYGGSKDRIDDGARDILIGGKGYDTYYVDSKDVIYLTSESDIQGEINLYNGEFNLPLYFSAYFVDEHDDVKIYEDKNGTKYELSSGNLQINGGLTIVNYEKFSYKSDLFGGYSSALNISLYQKTDKPYEIYTPTSISLSSDLEYDKLSKLNNTLVTDDSDTSTNLYEAPSSAPSFDSINMQLMTQSISAFSASDDDSDIVAGELALVRPSYQSNHAINF